MQVKDIPVSAASDFEGVVGNYNLAATINRRRLTTDDVVSLKIRLTGDGDPKRVVPPTLANVSAFESYEPQEIENKQFYQGNRQYHEVTYEYLLVPTEGGDFTISANLDAFSPDSNRVIKLGQSFSVQVTGSKKSRPSKIQDDLKSGLRDIHTIRTLNGGRKPIFHPGQVGFWLGAGLPVLAIAFGFLIKRRRNAENRLSPEERAMREARKLADKHLVEAKQALDRSDPRACYDAISRAVLGYVSDKFKLERSTLTKSTVKSALESQAVNDTQIELIMSILQRCEMALFAGQDRQADLESTYEQAAQVIIDVEQGLAA